MTHTFKTAAIPFQGQGSFAYRPLPSSALDAQSVSPGGDSPNDTIRGRGMDEHPSASGGGAQKWGFLGGGLGEKGMSHADLRSLPGRANRTVKKGRVLRWLVIDSKGAKKELFLDKRQLIQMCDLLVPIRDMRLMDSTVGYETLGQLLVRDNALVFAMEHARMLITAEKVILPMDGDKNENKDRFIAALEAMIADRAMELADQQAQAPGLGLMGGCTEVQPFELAVLEAGLGEICMFLSREVQALQAQAQPALEALTRKADTSNLEAVRRVKTLHQRLVGRLKSVHEVLERLMEDDGDMWRMCLTKQTQIKQGAFHGSGADSGLDITPLGVSISASFSRTASLAARMRHAAAFKRAHSSSNAADSILAGGGSGGGAPGPLGGIPIPTASGNLQPAGAIHERDPAPSESMDVDFLDVENLLESYFMLVDSTYQSLISIGEYIDDTEDLINIELDYSRNKLIRLEILVTIGTFSLAFFNIVTGMLGENLVIPPAITHDVWAFCLVNGVAACFCVLVFTTAYTLLKRQKVI